MASGIDLHMHSSSSDGTFAPAELVKKCAEIGLKKVALTDHDTITGVQEFLHAAQGEGLEAVSGIEFSAEYPGELHILGYGFDFRNQKLNQRLSVLAQERIERVKAFIARLNELSIDIRLEELDEVAKGATLGRPHIACVLVKKGYASSIEEAFAKYLDTNAIAFCERKKIASEEAISLIHGAGGLAVLAHPKLLETDDYRPILDRLTAEELDGIEAFYPAHTDEDAALFCEFAKKYGLLITAGSDYHGERRTSVLLGQEQRDSGFLQESVDEIFRRKL